jgi:hypothetical protein
MTRFPFLDPLEALIVEQFDALRPDYAAERAQEVRRALAAAIAEENEIRFALVDGETAQLVSPHLFDTARDALAHRDRQGLAGCAVATLIVDEQP